MAQQETKTAHKVYSFGEAMMYLEANPGTILYVDGETDYAMERLRYSSINARLEYQTTNEDIETGGWLELGSRINVLTRRHVSISNIGAPTLSKEWEPIVSPFGQYGKAVRRMLARLTTRIDGMEEKIVALEAALKEAKKSSRKGKQETPDSEPVVLDSENAADEASATVQ